MSQVEVLFLTTLPCSSPALMGFYGDLTHPSTHPLWASMCGVFGFLDRKGRQAQCASAFPVCVVRVGTPLTKTTLLNLDCGVGRGEGAEVYLLRHRSSAVMHRGQHTQDGSVFLRLLFTSSRKYSFLLAKVPVLFWPQSRNSITWEDFTNLQSLSGSTALMTLSAWMGL